MILRATILFLLMISSLAGMFLSNDNVVESAGKTMEDKRFKMQDLKEWSPASQIIAKELVAEYGMPAEFTESMLVWKNNGAWKKTILYKEGMKHDFPKPHSDVLEQTINFRVPGDKFDNIAMFNGSITANRTNGTLSVRCVNESLNILSLNFAYDVIKEKKTIGQARLEYYKSAYEIMNGKTPEYAQKLLFNSDSNASDPR